jgi:hypothetical protein
VGGKFRGVKDAMVREGLAWACGDVVSRILTQPEYTIRERDATRAALAARGAVDDARRAG